ncbi:MAG TPA: HEAT repeat domain-containing protein [Pirellulales bacterium]|nr:HEAT repeat domain-containing protein [Pirellulales bacterium]
MSRSARLLMPLLLAIAANAAVAADRSVESLLRSLSSDDAQARIEAARGISRLEGEKIAIATAELTKALGDRDPFVRSYAALALGKLEKVDAETVGALAKLLTDSEARVRGMAVRSLRRLKPGAEVMLPIMVKILEQADPQGAMLVIDTIAELGGDKAIAGLTNALKNERACYWACLALGEAGAKAKSAVPALVKVLSDDRTEIQVQALITLGKIGPDAAPAVAEITPFLKVEQPAVQYAAAYALGDIASPAGAEALKQARRSDDPMLKTIAVWGLAKISPDSKVLMREAAEQLVASLKSDDKYVRQAAARALVELRPDPELVRPALLAALADDDPAVRGNIVEAVAALGASATPDLVKGLKNPNFRDASAAILARIGPPAKAALPALLAALDDATSTERSSADDFHAEALVAIALIGPQDPAVVKKCTAMLNSENDRVRRTATYALGKAGAAAKGAMSALRGQLNGDDETLRMVTLWALLQITPGDQQIVKAAVPGLTKALEDSRPLVRLEAVLALGKLGSQAASAKAALEQLADDPDEAVRRAAAEAVEQVGR